MITRQSIVVRATAREVLELVADLDRYRLVDTKIVAVLKGCDLSTGDTGTTRYRGRLRGIPSPIDSNDVTLTRWSRIDFVGSPGSWVRRLVDFHGWVTCEPTDDGTLGSRRRMSRRVHLHPRYGDRMGATGGSRFCHA
jgi:hypothetical protein